METRTLRGVLLDVTQTHELEMQLRQAQKLESVGRLASGVAHEINTPVQFVSDNVHFLKDAFGDLTTVLDRHRTLRAAVADGTATAEAAAEVAQAEEEADVAYLLEAAPPAIERSIEGLGRIAEIVRSMKEFAHPDEKEKAATDLNKALASTLTIARNEYKYVADVTTDFGELPPVVCLPGEMNQVFLNIIVNASHAIADIVGGTEGRGEIAVSTRQDGADVVVTIADTGGGIPEAARERIFDPFFTTKSVGKGTGQGLAIARSVVVDQHGGEIRFESQSGKGTKFFIRLPIDGRAGQSTKQAISEVAA
jgi:signal transduction histidine kinase